MDMFEFVPIESKAEEKSNYVKTESFTEKTEQFFKLLNEMQDFLKPEYYSLKKRMEEFDKFKIKMNCIATIGNALSTKECKNAISEGYRLYIAENKKHKSN